MGRYEKSCRKEKKREDGQMNVTPFLKESNLKVYKDTIYDVKKIEEQDNWYIITTDEEVEWIDSDEYQLVVWITPERRGQDD